MNVANITRRFLPSLLNATQTPELAISAMQLACDSCNGTFGSWNVKTRVKRAKNSGGKTEYEYDYTDPEGPIDADTWTQIYYGIGFVLGFVLVVIQLYTSIFGRRMRNEGLRWHIIYCSVFNIMLIFVYADTADYSPWVDYMRNVYVTKHIVAIEQILLSAFPASITVMVPLYLVTYAAPNLRRTFVFKWLIWVVVYGALFAAPAFVGFKYYKSLDGSGNVPNDPLTGYYQFYANVASYITVLYLLIIALIGCVCMFSYAAVNCSTLEKNAMGQKVNDNISLFMIWIYIVVGTIFHFPKNVMNMSSFFMTNILPKIQTIMANKESGSDGSSMMSGSSTQDAMQMLLQYADLITKFLNFVPVSELMIPIVEFFAAAFLLQMYRESLLNLLSCGACYRSDKNGSIWNIIPDRFRSIYPLDAIRWAHPSLVAQGIVPPPPSGFVDNNSPMAVIHTSGSGKSPIMVEQL
ncbi:hypothetical protein M3Y94_00274500 [Aphelenchoides besseyi]|nr:hypothetical protein M3Y94_00274500 [Aphelenchoides besseyi]